jgi:predicted transcriptional regulator
VPKNSGDIVISLHEKYVIKMLSGQKTVELRRRSVHISPGSRVWIYTTSPKASIGVYATVDAVITAKPIDLWKSHGHQSGISAHEFNQYFAGASVACGIILRDFRKFPALKLDELRMSPNGFHPPQFMKRLPQESPGRRLLRQHAAARSRRPSALKPV